MGEDSIIEFDSKRFTPYHYAALSEGSKIIYKLIRMNLLEGKSSLFLKDFHKKVDYQKILVNVLNDSPIIFWASNALSISENANGTTLFFFYNEMLSKKDQYLRIIEDIARKLHQKISSNSKTKYEYALGLHDFLATTVKYDYGSLGNTEYTGKVFSAAHSIIGPLINHKAVCEGISRAYTLLLSAANIKSTCVWGKILENDELHAWNIVRFGHEWYHVDVTWDLSEDFLSH